MFTPLAYIKSAKGSLKSLAAFFSAVLVLSAPVDAATNYWLGDNDALWDTAGNWGLGTSPLISDDLIFPAIVPSTGATITLGAGETAKSLTFRNSYHLAGGDLSLGASGLVTVGPLLTVTIDSQLTGNGGLNLAANNGLAGGDAQDGGGTLVLGGANNFTGVTTVGVGILRVANASGLGETVGGAADGTVVQAGATLELEDVNIGTETLTLNGAGVGNLGAIVATGTAAAAGNVILASDSTVGGAGDLTLSGMVSGAFSLLKTGAGTLLLSNSNTYGGITQIDGGVVSIGDATNLGDGSATNGIVLNGGTLLSTGASVDLGANRSVSINSNSAVDVAGTNELIFSGPLSSGAGKTLTKTGSGILTLGGMTANDTAGSIAVTLGTLRLNKTGVNAIGSGGASITSSATGASVIQLMASDQIADDAPLTFSASGGQVALFNLNDFSDTVGAITMASNTVGSSTMATGANGVLTLNADLLLNNNRGASGNSGREILITGTGSYGMVAPSGTLDLGGAIRTITVNGANIANADATIETAIQNGGIIKEGSHALLLRGTNTYAGGTTVNHGTVVAFNDNALGTGTTQVNASGELALANTSFHGDVTLNGGTLSGAAGSNSDFAGSISVSSDSAIQLRDYATMLNTTPTARDLYISGAFSGAGALAISAPVAATLRLPGNSPSYTGQITVGDQVVLEVSSDGALGATGPGSGTVVLNGGSLRLLNNVNVGNEDLSIVGSGFENSEFSTDGVLRNLSGTNNFGGTVTLAGDSTIQSDGGNLTLSNPASIVGAGGNLVVRGLGEVTIGGSVNLGGGTFTKLDGGTLTFTSNLTSIPVTDFVDGTLAFTGPQSFGAVTIPDGLAFRFNSDPGPGVMVTAPPGTRIIAAYEADQTLLDQISVASSGVLALRFDNTEDLDFTTNPELSLGAAGTNLVTFSGDLTPGANGYRLGGGLGRLIVDTELSGNNALEVNGDVRLVGRNTFTGPITVNAGAQLAVLDNPNLGNAANVVTLDGGTLQVNEVSPSATALFFQLGNPINPVNNGQARTIVVGLGGGRIDVPAVSSGGNGVVITGANSLQGASGVTLTKSELGVLYLANSNDFAGHLDIAANGNQVDVRAGGALPNISSVTINVGGFLNVDNQNVLGTRQYPSAANDDRFNDAATINLLGGRLQYVARNATLSGTSSREIFGTVNVGLGQSEILSNRAGGGGGDLVISNLVHSYGGGSVRFTAGGTLGSSGNNGRTRIMGIGGNGVEPATGMFLGGWALVNTGDFATYVQSAIGAAGGVVVFGAAGAPAYATSIGAGNVANINGSITLPSGDSSTLALRLSQGAAQAITFADAADTLYFEGGGLLSDGQNFTRAIGTSSVRGNLTAGAVGGSTPQELFFHNNSNTMTIFANVIDNPGGGSLRVVKDLDGAVTFDSSANSYSGGTAVLRGTLSANRTGSLGSGAVLVKNAALNVGTFGASSGTGVASTDPVIKLQDNSTLTLTSSSASSAGAYTADGDRFYISAGSTIYANSPGTGFGFNSLTRVDAFTGGGQIILEPDAVVQHNTTDAPDQGAGSLTINNLGTQADLYFGVGNTVGANATLTIGGGTPWKGLSSDRNTRTWEQGTIYANSDFYLQGLTRDNGQATLVLGSTATGAYSIVNTAGKPIDAFIQGTVQLNDDDGPTLPSDLTFVVMPGSLFQPNRVGSLGTGANVASVVVQAGGTLDPGSYVGVSTASATYGRQTSALVSPLNGSVTVRAGGRFLINDASGIGSALAGSYLIKKDGVLELGNSAVFRGSGDLPLGGSTNTGLITPGQFVFEPGAIVRFIASDIVGVSQFVLGEPNGTSLIYEVVNGNRRLIGQSNLFIEPELGVPVADPENFTIGTGGVLTNDSADRQADGNGGGHLILQNGAVLAATTQTIFSVNATTVVEPGATVTIGSLGSIDGNYKLGTVNFNEANNLKMGAGSSFSLLDGTTLEFSNVNVYPDDGDLNLPIAVSDIASGVSTMPGTGTSLWLATNGIETIRKLTGVGRVHTNQSSVTLEVGNGLAVGDDFEFAGEFSNAAGQNPNVAKVGEGTFFITGPASGNTSTGLMTAYGGTITLKDNGGVHFTSNIGPGGTIVLDNSGVAVDDRLSGGNISSAGGNFVLIGNASIPVTESVGQLNNQQFPGGIGHFSVEPGNAPTTLTFNTIQEYQNSDRRASFVFRGASMAGLPGPYDQDGIYTPNAANPSNGLITANNPNLTSRTSVNQAGNLITAAAGTPVVAIRPDILGSLDPNSVFGDRLVTQDNSSTGFRLLADSEYTSSILSDYTTGPANVKLSGNIGVSGDTRINSLTFTGGSTTLSITGTQATGNWPSRLLLYAPAIVVESGANATIEGVETYIDRANGSPWYFYTFGDLTLNVGVIGSNGFQKSGPGTLIFGEGALSLNHSAQGGAYGGNFWGGSHTINGGTVIMNDSITFLRGQNNNNAPHLVMNDGLLNLNGYSQIYNRLDSASPIPNTGGTITSATPAVLTNYGGGTFSGHIEGALSYTKAYNTTETFTSENTYTGPTLINGGTLALVDDGKLTNTPEITLKYGTLLLDNTNRNATANRIRSDININSLGGTFDLRGRLETQITQDVATAPGTAFNLLGRDTTIRLDAGGLGSTTLTIGNMTRSDDATTLLFTTGYGTFGYPVAGKQDLHVFFNLNGSAPTLTNGILGGWAVTNSSFASYYPAAGVGEVGDIASGFPATVGGTITGWNATTNANFSGSPSATLGTVAVNSLRMLDSGVNPTVAFSGSGSLTLTSGGLITNQNRTVTFGSTSSRGTITSGSPYLYAWIFQSTTVLNSIIADNAGAKVGLIKLAGGALQLTAPNTYTGDTYVYQGSLSLNNTSANGTNVVTVPGDLYAVGGDVTESAARQIASTAKLTVGGGSAITLRGGTAETFSSFTLLNEGGGTSNNRPIITGTNTGGSVNLTAADAISVVDNGLFTTPTLSVNLGTVNFVGAPGTPQIISVSGDAGEPLGFVFNPNIGTVPSGVMEGGLVKIGPGMMALGGSGANQFGVPGTGPATEVFNIQEGIVRIDNANALGNNFAITTVQPGSVLLARNISSTTAGIGGSIVLKGGTVLGVTEGSGTFGVATTDPAALATLTIGGNIDLYTTDYFLPVTQSYTLTINSKLTGSGNINVIAPAGPSTVGVLRLGNNITGSDPGANDYSGTITLNPNAQLLSQPTATATAGSELGGAAIVLNGGEIRVRDNGIGSNGILAYGNNVTLQASSAINVDRIGVNSNNLIQFGTLTLSGGTLDLTVTGGNSYDVGFAQIDGPGTFRKEGAGELYFDSFGPTLSGDFEVTGPQGLSVQPAQGLNFNAASNDVSSLIVSGNYLPLTGKAVNVGTLTVSPNSGVLNGLNGVSTGSRTGAISIPNGAVLTAGVLQNDGRIGATGTGGAEIVATSIKGRGFYQTNGQPLTITGQLNDPTGIFRVTGGTSANDVVTLNATNSAVINRVEVQSGTLRITDATSTFTPLGTNIAVLGYPPSVPGQNSQAVAAAGGTLLFDTTASGNTIQHAGDIESSGTVRVGGIGVVEVSGSIHGSCVSYVPGLLEGRIGTSSLDTSATRPGNPGNFGIQLEPRMAQTNLVTGNAFTGWENNTLWVYSGEFYDADGVFSFAENLDDRVLISIDGVNVLINGSSSQVTSTAFSVGQSSGTFNIAGANTGTPTRDFGMGPNGNGWHTIEIRIANGTSGAGAVANNGFAPNYGMGLNIDGPTALDGSLYSRPIDPGDGSLFRTAVGGKGNVIIDPGAILRVSNLTAMANVTINGGSTVDSALELTGTGTSDTDTLTVTNLGTLDIPVGHTMSAGKLSVGTLGEFLKTGPGLLSVGGSGGIDFASTSLVTVDSGTLYVGGTSAPSDSSSAQVYVDGDDAALIVSGSLAGHVSVGQIFGGGRLGGVGIVGDVDVAFGTIAPGDPLQGTGLGTLSTGNLTLNSSAVFELQLGGTTPGAYGQLNVTGQVNLDGELRLSLAGTFTPSNGDLFTIIANDDIDPVSVVGTGFLNAMIDDFYSTVYPTVFDTSGNPYLLSFTGEGGQFDAGGNDVVLMSVVPESGAASGFLFALGMLLGIQRFRPRVFNPIKL